MVEEWKWRGTPFWCAPARPYQTVVKPTFAHGAALPGLFNASLEGNTRRAIDLRETHVLDEAAIKTLIQAAVARSVAKRKKG